MNINELLEKELWKDAELLIKNEIKKSPNDHWLITQYGVSLYEQKKYKRALKQFHIAQNIVKECPLVLWNLAGCYVMTKQKEKAIHIYQNLIQSNVSYKEDPCWESYEWTDQLKIDCKTRLEFLEAI